MSRQKSIGECGWMMVSPTRTTKFLRIRSKGSDRLRNDLCRDLGTKWKQVEIIEFMVKLCRDMAEMSFFLFGSFLLFVLLIYLIDIWSEFSSRKKEKKKGCVRRSPLTNENALGREGLHFQPGNWYKSVAVCQGHNSKVCNKLRT
jgi:hypothetical protein